MNVDVFPYSAPLLIINDRSLTSRPPPPPSPWYVSHNVPLTAPAPTTTYTPPQTAPPPVTSRLPQRQDAAETQCGRYSDAVRTPRDRSTSVAESVRQRRHTSHDGRQNVRTARRPARQWSKVLRRTSQHRLGRGDMELLTRILLSC